MNDTRAEPRLYQLSYVTTELELGIETVQEARGVPLEDLGVVSLALDDGGEAVVRIAMGFVRDLMFEVIEPISGEIGVYTSSLPKDRPAVQFHHMAYKVGSLEELHFHRNRLVARGHNIALEGGNPERARWIYFDFRRELGHYLEYLYLTPERERVHNSLPRAE